MAVLTGADAERRGKPALTRYRTERAWGGSACALLRCRLLTGRTHQIRVHLAHAGHPLVGDPVYLRRIPAAARLLPQREREALLSFPRQALHAATLRSEEHTSELQSRQYLVCRLLLEKKKHRQ